MRIALLTAFCCTALAAPAFAALPPPSDAAKAQAAEKAAKTAWTNKVAAYKLCQAQDRAVANYHSNTRQQGKPAPEGAHMPACVDPGPFSAAAAPQRPLEVSGAHSPAETAAKPPSTPSTQGEIDGKAKK
jgi:hypothetical protein